MTLSLKYIETSISFKHWLKFHILRFYFTVNVNLSKNMLDLVALKCVELNIEILMLYKKTYLNTTAVASFKHILHTELFPSAIGCALFKTSTDIL